MTDPIDSGGTGGADFVVTAATDLDAQFYADRARVIERFGVARFSVRAMATELFPHMTTALAWQRARGLADRLVLAGDFRSGGGRFRLAGRALAEVPAPPPPEAPLPIVPPRTPTAFRPYVVPPRPPRRPGADVASSLPSIAGGVRLKPKA